ncbi:feruloyl-CoA synthase [Mesobaculum littorinae]|uniref:Feruloyl-CoA synthase n=1 Tax=Mesobaculum littorinae TaxID=2486419 RepID=A0A438AI81_9RHOB|nr:feruloyl-CoA synthase [Mesobaculum littorinae]RVV98453.1 feruloyl-CoA synthase [Mesobaculum littorinae]
MDKIKTRAFDKWAPQLGWERKDDGSWLIWRDDPLGDYPARMNERLIHWARTDPDRTWMAQRDGDDWQRISYGALWRDVQALGQALLDRDLGPDRPVMILSGNDLDHARLALAAQHVGVPSAAISPAYSLVSTDYEKLSGIVEQITPGLVFAADGALFAKAIAAAVPSDTPVAVARNPVEGRDSPLFSDLLATEPTDAVARAFDATGPDTVAKFLFTSGTTGSPKAVIQTQRMLCSNQEMIADSYAFMRSQPPVVVDWAPWNHTASGNKVFNLTIYHGGTYYLDEGKPSPKAIGETIRNLREISPTWYFNVPAGYEMLVDAMEDDDQLRESFFRDLNMMMYAGAGMADHTWRRLRDLAVRTVGAEILLSTGLGATETGPFAINCMEPQEVPGNVGIPSQGVVLKLVPNGGKLEARLKGPHITPGYWRAPELTAKAFDDEGYYLLGDALRFAVEDDPAQGFLFDGRIAENFKLRTGTWVAVGPLRAKLVDELGGLARDAVITGQDQEELGAILIPYLPTLRALLPAADRGALSDAEVVDHPAVRDELARRLGDHAARATGSATRVKRVVFIDSAPALDRGEVTDKGSINQRAVLRHRDHLVQALYADDPRVIHPDMGEAAA